MRVERLTLKAFRNYANLRLAVAPGPVVLTGANGSGKTNLLEALSLMAPGKGLRGASYDAQLCHGVAAPWSVAVELSGRQGNSRISTSWKPAADASDEEAASAARQLRVDGELQRGLAMLTEHLRIVWLTPAMDRLFAGPASERRRFLDRVTGSFDPEHGRRVGRLERLLRERNRLLGEPQCDRVWLDGLEEQLAGVAVALAAARLGACDLLQSQIDCTRGETGQASAFPAAEMAIDGHLECALAERPAVQVEDEYRRLLHDSRRLDRETGRTRTGPHRSDLVVTFGPKQMPAQFCSSGEQKALLVGMVLAQARAIAAQVSMTPLMLLDEIGAHLDTARRADLFGEIGRLGCQAWMTGTERHLFCGMPADTTFLTIDDGAVRAEDALTP